MKTFHENQYIMSSERVIKKFCSYAQFQVSNVDFYIEQRNEPEKFGSISVSGHLPTYPSPNLTLTLICYQ